MAPTKLLMDEASQANIMTEQGGQVACRALGILFRELKKSGLPVELLLKDVAYNEKYLRNKDHWITWAEFHRILENAGSLWDEPALIDIGKSFVTSRFARSYMLAAYTPMDFYLWAGQSQPNSQKMLFTCVERSVVEHGEDYLVVKIRLNENCRPSKEFNLIAKGAFSAITTLFEQPAATVEMHLPDNDRNSILYDIRLGRHKGLMTRWGDYLKKTFTKKTESEALRESNLLLRKGYRKLRMEVLQREKAEAALRESERRAQLIAEFNPDFVAQIDPDGLILFSNRSGINIGQIRQPMHYSELISDKQALLQIQRGLDTVFETGEPYSFDFQEVDSGDPIRCFSAKVHPIPISDGEVDSAMLVLKDVSEQKQVELTLREREDRLNLIVAATRDGIYEYHIDTQQVWRSEIYHRHFVGNSKYSADLKWWENRVHPDDLEQVRQQAFEAITGNAEVFVTQYRFKMPDDRFIWVDDRSVVMRDENGKAIKLIGAMRDINSRKIAEKTLRDNIRFLTTFIDTIPNPIFYKNKKREYIGCNEAFAKFLNIEKKDIIGRLPVDFFPELSAECRKSDEELLENGKSQHRELQLVRGDKAVRDVLLFQARIDGDDGEVTGIVGGLIDITDRKQTEIALQESESRYRSLVEMSPDAIVVHQNNMIVFANNAGVKLVGATSAAELVGRNIREFVETEYHEKMDKRAQLLREQKQLPVIEQKIMRANGTPAFVEAIAKSVKFRGEDATQLVIRDISGRKKAEEALRNQERQYRDIFDSVMDGVLILTPDLKIAEVNPMACSMYGYSYDEILKIKPEELVAVDYVDSMRYHLDKIKSGKPVVFDSLHIRKDGHKFPVEKHCALTVFRDEEHIMVLVRDISERKQAENERRKLEEQIQHAQKLESLGVLAGGIAHDFNNLLTGILGNAGLAMLELGDDSPAERSLQNIEKASLRAAELCKQMLAYAGKGKFHVKPIDLNLLVKEMTHLLKVSISKKVALNYDFAPDLPTIEADTTQIRQVIMNLITNASEAIGNENGVITVSTGTMYCSEEYLRTAYLDNYLEAGSYVYVDVKDSGCGMDRPTISRIFDPFFTTKFTGRGLGLAAVLGIVRSHGGTVKIDSKPDKGTTFRVFLPESDKQAADVQLDSKTDTSWRASGKVLVVDDEETVRETSRHVLEYIGFEVVCANDGQEAVEIFRDCGDDIALVLLDMTMPRMNGEETFHALRKMRDDVRVVLTSGFNEQEATSCFNGEGLAGFIQKPYLSNQLIQVLQRIFDE